MPSPQVYTMERTVTGLTAASIGMTANGDALLLQNEAELCAFAIPKKRLTVQLDITHATYMSRKAQRQKHTVFLTNPLKAHCIVKFSKHL